MSITYGRRRRRRTHIHIFMYLYVFVVKRKTRLKLYPFLIWYSIPPPVYHFAKNPHQVQDI